ERTREVRGPAHVGAVDEDALRREEVAEGHVRAARIGVERAAEVEGAVAEVVAEGRLAAGRDAEAEREAFDHLFLGAEPQPQARARLVAEAAVVHDVDVVLAEAIGGVEVEVAELAALDAE